MEKKSYIVNRFKNILNETLNQRSEEVLEKLNLRKQVPFRKSKMSADYIEERKSMCESCGGEMKEGENCENCGGGRGKEVMELGGMDDGHPKFGKMFSKEIERLLRGDDDEDDKTSSNMRSRRKNSISKSKTNSDSMSRSERYQKYDDMNEETYNNEFDSSMSNSEFDKYRRKEDQELYEISFDDGYNEVGEGNEFGFELDKARKKGEKTFKVGGKTLPVKGSRVNENLYKINVNNESALFTEEELITIIENIVNEEKNNIEKGAISKGMSEYKRVHKDDKKNQNKYFNDLSKKMTDYVKGSSDSDSKYEMKETKKFPTQNGGNRKKYTPSDAVDEYLEAFSYPGQTNLRFEEIKPNDENIEKYLKGDSTTGNAQVDKDGNALGNVVPSEVGEKFYNNYKENLYGKEQSEASYKRYPQPVYDVAGEDTPKGNLKSKKGKTSQSIFSKLEESIETKKNNKLNEEFGRIQSLMIYDRRTQ